MKELLKQLQAPFGEDSVKWKIQATKGQWSTLVAYIDARDVAQRLDDTAGMWQDTYLQTAGMFICRISIYIDGQWVSREDVGEVDAKGGSTADPNKTLLSDAFKRAAVKWGIGRHLYDLPIIKVKNGTNGPVYDGRKLYDATAAAKVILGSKWDGTVWRETLEGILWYECPSLKGAKPAPKPAPKPALTSNAPGITQEQEDEIIELGRKANCTDKQISTYISSVKSGKRTFEQLKTYFEKKQ